MLMQALKVEDYTFSYLDAKNPALIDVNLEIAKGEIVEYCRDADTKDILTVSTMALPVEPMSLINRCNQDSR